MFFGKRVRSEGKTTMAEKKISSNGKVEETVQKKRRNGKDGGEGGRGLLSR